MSRFQSYAASLAFGLSLAVLTLPFAGLADEAPDPAGPVIYLSDNLDEADGLGWCIDTLGRGFAETLQTHSCKPQGGDTQFQFDAATGQIQSVPFDGKCMAFSDPANASVPFGLVDCDPADQSQMFSFENGRITLGQAPDQCVVAGGISRSAGPFMSRDLTVKTCADADPALATWIFKP